MKSHTRDVVNKRWVATFEFFITANTAGLALLRYCLPSESGPLTQAHLIAEPKQRRERRRTDERRPAKVDHVAGASGLGHGLCDGGVG
jgi:hypothetical protein